ncbi:hypothetical protein KFL_016350010 [Klebsormidium nitens]|uniref:Uncharacterized protein n=1 Tax=Klebsormidium nitens TaxID=105231 RepID=A0A1Y1ITY0_KLENI|nr:hypothetical protein KFL_016350010 [Klebsormidium nitens]|eukprot:GAQ93542.1 hypothetical protein KFL_016350010 [Klebsormidium nitens]
MKKRSRGSVGTANLFALGRATDAGARVVLEGRKAQIESDGVVRMEAVKRGGLWEIETVGKQPAFLAREPVRKNRVTATAKRPVRAEDVVKKTVKVMEVDLEDLDDEIITGASVILRGRGMRPRPRWWSGDWGRGRGRASGKACVLARTGSRFPWRRRLCSTR